ncbi:MAG: hypothetical protein HOL48_02870 [Porticoccaceae bacterium]|jgi:hypothetical protein|nr:hypothetical protein [Porticoccaceae bacterium]
MTLPTPAGQTRAKPNQDQIEAVNTVFSIFRVNYHNQYYKAFPDTETLNTIKKLWLSSLSQVPAEVIVGGAEIIVQRSEFLPTLAQMLQACCLDKDGKPVPDARSAFIEACNAPSPKVEFSWSHPLVYHAGQKTGWHRLASSDENYSFPIFRQQYQNLLEAMMRGEHLPAIEAKPAADNSSETNKKAAPLDRDAAQKRLAELRAKLED